MLHTSEVDVLDQLKQLELVLKHMPGKHDQKLHAGTRGGVSANSGVAPTNGYEEDKAALDYYKDGVGWKLDVDMPADGEDARFKDAVVTQLAEDTRLTYGRTNQLIACWTVSSNDNNVESLGMQKAASEELGVELSDFQKQRIEHVTTTEGDIQNPYGVSLSLDRRVRDYECAREDGRKLIRAMYDRTQRELADAGIEKVKVFRGMTFESTPTVAVGDELQARGNAMESWSLKYDVASAFSRDLSESYNTHGMVMSAEFPAGRVVCIPKTGFGCLDEYEVIVSGSKPGQLDGVRVVEVN